MNASASVVIGQEMTNEAPQTVMLGCATNSSLSSLLFVDDVTRSLTTGITTVSVGANAYLYQTPTIYQAMRTFTTQAEAAGAGVPIGGLYALADGTVKIVLASS